MQEDIIIYELKTQGNSKLIQLWIRWVAWPITLISV
jgi:hypothetical protein